MANIKKIKVGSETHDIEALHFIVANTSLDTPADWKAYIDAAAHVGIEIVIDEKSSQGDYPATPASADTMGKLYMVPLNDPAESGSYTEFVTVTDEGGLRYAWEKIGTTEVDLTDYAKKGTYTSGGPSTNATGSAGAETITTSSSGAQTATGTIRLVDHAIAAHSHTVNVTTQEVNTDAIKDITLSASDTTTDGPVYVSSVSGTFNTDAIKDIGLTPSSTSTDGPAYVQSISGSAPSLGGTTTFVTGYDRFNGGSGSFLPTKKYMKVTTTSTSASDKGTVTLNGGSVSGSFNTNAISAVAGARNYGFQFGLNRVMAEATVDSDGVLSWSETDANTRDAHTGTAAALGSVSYTAPTLGGTTTFLTTAVKSVSLSASSTSGDGPVYMEDAEHRHNAAALNDPTTATVTISGGSYTATTRYMKHTTTAAGTGSVNKTLKYMKHTNTAAGKTAVVSGATLSTAGATRLVHSVDSSSATLAVSVAIADHTHTVTTSNHTHTLGNHTHNTVLN